MTNATPVLSPPIGGKPDDPPTLVWRSRVLTIPNAPYSAHGPIPRPFPFEPVIRLCTLGRLTGVQATRGGAKTRPNGEIIRTAEVLDVDRQRVYRWTKRGLTADQADVIAIMFGLHPCLVWPDWFAQVPDEEEIAAAELRAVYGDMRVSA
jgi:hypothetical protein